MSESVDVKTPFICKWTKWTGPHPEPQHFSTQKELEHHVYNDHENLANLKIDYQTYECPWTDCESQPSDIPKLKEHLRKHTQQKPFKCPTCGTSPHFESFNELDQHLIFKHRVSIMDPGSVDMTNQKEDAFCPNILRQGNIAKSAKSSKYDVESDDYVIFKGLAAEYDRESFEKLLAGFRYADARDLLDEFF